MIRTSWSTASRAWVPSSVPVSCDSLSLNAVLTCVVVVYQIKCLIDETLDATENITDAILNDLEDILPALKALDGQAAQTACAAGIEIANICVPL